MAKKTATKSKSGPRGRRKSGSYDNTRRSQKSAETQLSVVKAMVDLLVKRRGGEVPIEEIARKSGISERSIFRFFKDKQALLKATDQYIHDRFYEKMAKVQWTNVADFGRDVFGLCDANANLTIAWLFSPMGHGARTKMRKKLNEYVMGQLIKERGRHFPANSEAKLALIISLINAKLWYDLRHDYDFDDKEIGESVAWAIRTLSSSL